MSQQAEKLAKGARVLLAEALNALQTSADVPDVLMEVADPIAAAMGALHKIERTQGQDLSGKDVALKSVRAALDQLQSFDFSHVALDIVMEKVAGCLSGVHQLSRMASPSQGGIPAPAPSQPRAAAPAPIASPAPAPPQTIKAANVPAPQPMAAGPLTAPLPAPPPVAVAPAPSHSPVPVRAPTPAPQAYVPAPVRPPDSVLGPNQTAVMANSPAPSGSPGVGPRGTLMQQAAVASPAPSVDAKIDSTFPLSRPAAQEVRAAPLPAAAQPTPVAPPQSVHVTAPVSARSIASTQADPAPAPSARQPVAAAEPARSADPFPATRRELPPQTNRKDSGTSNQVQGNVVVELGAHSASNFYKGLGGNDVIEHGGLFVATYKIPKLGANVMLRVLLPGDYEFTAAATVQWTREPSDGADSFDPGFGARFTQITPEGRQLVYRYTRNREPMFYDDL